MKPEYKTYAWKPVIIREVFREQQGHILWLDSANIILKNLAPVWEIISDTGCYVPYSGSGTLKEWTVQATLDYMNVPASWYSQRNRAGNTCGFSCSDEIIQSVIEKWYEFALIRECIKPEGANRGNHRDDQSLLTILLMEAATKENLILTRDEVDISSRKPNPFVSVRNFVASPIPENLNAVTMAFFKMRRQVDILINRFF